MRAGFGAGREEADEVIAGTRLLSGQSREQARAISHEQGERGKAAVVAFSLHSAVQTVL